MPDGDSPQRPNIMLLVAEDTGCHHGCYGGLPSTTPALDRFARSGALYRNAFATAPVCAPSRCSMVSGQYAFSLGAHNMRSWLYHPPKAVTEYLREQGYFVNWANKQDFNFTPNDGFADMQREWVDDLARGELPDRPWFLYYNFGVTHESFMWPSKWERGVTPVLAENARHTPDQVRVPAYLPDTLSVRRDIARYHDALTVQDRQFERILRALDASGQAESTVVIYIADHGRGLPREKRWCYDAGIHVPLLIRWPGVVDPGAEHRELVSGVDIAPTLLSIAGIRPPPQYQGQAFLGEYATDQPREYCLAGRDRMDEAYDRVRVLRDEHYLYIRNYYPELPYAQRIDYMERQNTTTVMRELHAHGMLDETAALWMAESKPAEELYCCNSDPDNVRNLAGDSRFQERLLRMRQALDTVLERTPDLGELSERELIDRGIVCDDHLKKYMAKVQPLPPYQRIGVELTVVEKPAHAERSNS